MKFLKLSCSKNIPCVKFCQISRHRGKAVNAHERPVVTTDYT